MLCPARPRRNRRPARRHRRDRQLPQTPTSRARFADSLGFGVAQRFQRCRRPRQFSRGFSRSANGIRSPHKPHRREPEAEARSPPLRLRHLRPHRTPRRPRLRVRRRTLRKCPHPSQPQSAGRLRQPLLFSA
jgi:hypothetical protein